MDAFMRMLLGCTLTMSAVSALLLALTPWLSRRYSAKWLHLAWVLVLVCLLVPWRPQAAQPAVTLAVPPARALRTARSTPAQAQPVAAPHLPQAQAPAANAAASPAATPQGAWPQLTTAQLAFGIWAVGAAASLVWRAASHRRFCRRVRRLSRPVGGAAKALFDQIKDEMRIRGRVGLALCGAADSPMLAGILRPCILLPEACVGQADLALVLRHELAHYKRRDLYGRLLLTAAWAVHWFNPLLPIIGRAMALQSEAACDAMVTRGMDLDARQAYGAMILHALRRGAADDTAALTTRFNGGKHMMKQRLMAILDSGRKRRGGAVLALLLAAVMAGGMAVAVEPVSSAAPAHGGVSGIAIVDTREAAEAGADEDAARARMQAILSDMGYDAQGLTLRMTAMGLSDGRYAHVWEGEVGGAALTLFGHERMLRFTGGKAMAAGTLASPAGAATDAERAALRARASAFANAYLLLPGQAEDRPVMASDMLYTGPEEACGYVWVYACTEPIYHVMESQPYDSAEPENNWGYALLVGMDTGKIYSLDTDMRETDFVNTWSAASDWTARTGQPAPFPDYQYMFDTVSPMVRAALAEAVRQHGDGLTDAEYLQAWHLALYPDQYLQDRHGDWQRLLDDLAAVDGPEALQAVLQTAYRGINETYDGQHSSRMVIDMANDHLAALGYGGAGPRTFAYSGPHGGGYEVRAWTEGVEKATWDALAEGARALAAVSLDHEGALVTVNAEGFDGRALAGERMPITAAEAAWLKETVRAVVTERMDIDMPIDWAEVAWPTQVTQPEGGLRVARVELMDGTALADGHTALVRVQADVAGQQVLSIGYYTVAVEDADTAP